MTTRTTETSHLIYARVAGFTFLFYIAAGMTSLALAGRTNVTDVLGLVSDLLAPLVLILVVLALYKLLKPVNKIWFFFLGNYWPKRTYYKLSPKKII